MTQNAPPKNDDPFANLESLDPAKFVQDELVRTFRSIARQQRGGELDTFKDAAVAFLRPYFKGQAVEGSTTPKTDRKVG